jgi:hypothetical protein
MALSTGCVQGRPDAAVDDPGLAPMRPRGDLCNNGLDDDRDNNIDENCGCEIGAAQRCSSDGAIAGVGLCTFGIQHCVATDDNGIWGPCMGWVSPAPESCDGFDDDCDSKVDEGCDCTPGTTQTCFASGRAEAAVGRCVGGMQTCVMDPSRSIDGDLAYTWTACEGAQSSRAERCNALDDDCNGSVDDMAERCNGVDDDCDLVVDEGEACVGGPPVRALTAFWPVTGSGALPPSASLYTTISMADLGCAPDEIILEATFGEPRCVPRPPVCEGDTRPIWIADAWQCAPCEMLIQFGYLFDFERVCAPEPGLTCPDGEVPTYREFLRDWVCAPTCTNTDYDQAFYEGELICVPC